MGRDFGARIALAAAEVYALLPDEDRVRIFPRSGNAPWQQCPKIGQVPVKARRRAMLRVNR
jgi:hypothetical protein